MAKCPQCGKRLRIYNWKPNCPECGTNLNYFKANERMLDESEKAEIEHARFQPKVDRGKAATISSKLSIVRIVLSLLPVGALMLPLCKLTADSVKSINAVSLYKFISSADLGAIFGGVFSGDLLAVSVVVLLLSVVMILVNLVCLIMSLGKHGKTRNYIICSVMTGCAVLSTVFLAVFSKNPSSVIGQYESAAVGIGAFAYVFACALLFGWNIFLFKRGISFKYTQCYIGGLPSEEYFSYVDQGLSKSEIRRKMLVALAEQQDEYNKKLKAEEEKHFEEKLKDVQGVV